MLLRRLSSAQPAAELLIPQGGEGIGSAPLPPHQGSQVAVTHCSRPCQLERWYHFHLGKGGSVLLSDLLKVTQEVGGRGFKSSLSNLSLGTIPVS